MAALATIVAEAPFEGTFAPDKLQYVAAEPIDSKPCDRIRFDANGYTYDLWLDQANHQIRRVEPDMKPLEEKFSAEYGTTFDFTVTANITKWDANADVTKTIAFAAPEGVESVARFSPPHELSEAEKMAGSPAPDFTLPLLAGGEMTLSKEKGNVIILDFWATWCGPCRVAMPAVEEVIKEFAGKNVKLYSVNGGEDADTVKSFLEQSKLDVPVALDTNNEVTALYKAEAIPQTVIIGPDGVIRIVHVGLWAMPEGDLPDSREEAEKLMHEALVKSLREEIQSVLATTDTKK
jgi:thiol-disulfide isomerase/thioredoxin